jgi:hypothetical protein
MHAWAPWPLVYPGGKKRSLVCMATPRREINSPLRLVGIAENQPPRVGNAPIYRFRLDMSAAKAIGC